MADIGTREWLDGGREDPWGSASENTFELGAPCLYTVCTSRAALQSARDSTFVGGRTGVGLLINPRKIPHSMPTNTGIQWSMPTGDMV